MVTFLIAAIALLAAVIGCALIAPSERDTGQPEWGLDVGPGGPRQHEFGLDVAPGATNSDE
ncbi:MAG TPA: hypothetical protein VGH36_08265 [Acetobacteraceae bacterium]